MTIYIKRVEEFEIRQFLPNDPGFDKQEFIDWLLSFSSTVSSWYPVNATENPDGSLDVEILDTAGGGWNETLQDGMVVLYQVGPALPSYKYAGVAPEQDFNMNFEEK